MLQTEYTLNEVDEDFLDDYEDDYLEEDDDYDDFIGLEEEELSLFDEEFEDE